MTWAILYFHQHFSCKKTFLLNFKWFLKAFSRFTKVKCANLRLSIISQLNSHQTWRKMNKIWINLIWRRNERNKHRLLSTERSKCNDKSLCAQNIITICSGFHWKVNGKYETIDWNCAGKFIVKIVNKKA